MYILKISAKIIHQIMYLLMDCFIFPSTLKESLGLVGLEAMACGIPVIASDSHGPTDYIEDRKNGFLFSTGDICSLIDKVDYYYKLLVVK